MATTSTLVQTKIHHHALEHVTLATITTTRRCGFCGASPISHRCPATECSYHACNTCVVTSKVVQSVPLHHHPLEYIMVMGTTTTATSGNRCDACNASVSREAWFVSSTRWMHHQPFVHVWFCVYRRCNSCDYDLCILCFQAVSSPVAKSSSSTSAVAAPSVPAAVVPIKSTIMSSMVVPIHAHALSYATDNLTGHWCDLCRVKVETACWRCSSCNFDACTTCIDRITVKPSAVATPSPAPSAVTPPTKIETKVAASSLPASIIDGGMTKAHRHELNRVNHTNNGKWCDGCKVSVKTSYTCVPCNL